MKSYKFLEDIAIADVAFEAKGDSLEEARLQQIILRNLTKLCLSTALVLMIKN